MFRRCTINKKRRENDKYHRILEAAIKTFAENGFFQSTIAQIAKEAGVADGTIYLYFKNKDDLLISLFETKMEQILQRFNVILEKSISPPEKLMEFIQLLSLIHISEPTRQYCKSRMPYSA